MADRTDIKVDETLDSLVQCVGDEHNTMVEELDGLRDERTKEQQVDFSRLQESELAQGKATQGADLVGHEKALQEHYETANALEE